MRRALVLIVLAPLAVGCGAGDAVSLDEVANAADATAEYAGVRIDMTMTTSVPGLSGAITTTSSGVVDRRSKRGQMTVDMTDVRREAMAGIKGAAKRLGPPEAWRGEMVLDFARGRFVAYMRIPFMSRAVQTSKPWVKFDYQKLGEQAGIDFQQFVQLGGGNPAEAVDYLRAVSGKVEERGNEQVRGVETTHYHVTIDFEKYPNLVPPSRRDEMRKTIDQIIKLTGEKSIPADVWIGDDQLVRKMRYAYTMRIRDERTGRRQPRHIDLAMELYDFGASASVALPPAGRVFDLSTLIEKSA